MVGCSWLDDAEKNLVVATSKSSWHCIGENGIVWSKPNAFVRQPTAMTGIKANKSDGRPARMAVALEKPSGSKGGVEINKFDIVLYNISDAASADSIEEKSTLEGHIFEVSTLRFSPDGRYLVSGDTSK